MNDVRVSESKLVISYQMSHKHVSKDTQARWLRDVLSKAGVDTQQFGAHSTRVASSSLVQTVPVWLAALWCTQYQCG